MAVRSFISKANVLEAGKSSYRESRYLVIDCVPVLLGIIWLITGYELSSSSWQGKLLIAATEGL